MNIEYINNIDFDIERKKLNVNFIWTKLCRTQILGSDPNAGVFLISFENFVPKHFTYQALLS